MIAIRDETVADQRAIGEVNRRAFGQDDEARLVEREVDGAVVGHILCSEINIVAYNGHTTPALSLAPMAVVPEFQRRGIGAQLVRAALASCRAREQRIVVVLGHPAYYPRFGFSAELARNLVCPYGGAAEAWMALELVPGALTGVEGRVEYSPPFADL
jgi:putative acetyltransferase